VLKASEFPKGIREVKIPKNVKECSPSFILANEETNSSFPVFSQTPNTTYGFSKKGSTFVENLATDERSPLQRPEVIESVFNGVSHLVSLSASSSFKTIRLTGTEEVCTLACAAKVYTLRSLIAVKLIASLQDFLQPNETNKGLKLIGIAINLGIKSHNSDPGRVDTTAKSKLTPEQLGEIILASCQGEQTSVTQFVVMMNHRQTVDVLNNILSQTLSVLKQTSPIIDSIVEVYLRATLVSTERGYQRLLSEELTFDHRRLVTKLSFERRAEIKSYDYERSKIRTGNDSEKSKAQQVSRLLLEHDLRLTTIDETGGMLWEIYNLQPNNVVASTYLDALTATGIKEDAEVKFSGEKDSFLKSLDSNVDFFGFTLQLYKAWSNNTDSYEDYISRSSAGKLDVGEKVIELMTLKELCDQVRPQVKTSNSSEYKW
jgi:hypothetical protein